MRDSFAKQDLYTSTSSAPHLETFGMSGNHGFKALCIAPVKTLLDIEH